MYKCFTLNEIKKITKEYNKYCGEKIMLSQNKSNLCKELRCKLNCKLNKNKIVKKIVKPLGPKNKWLTTNDINNVMNEYEKIYPDFLFLGAVPIDFEKVVSEMSNFNLKKVKNNTIGIIFNLDAHNEPGSHWVSLFIDMNEKTICFFDSVGDKPVKEINKFIKKVTKQGKQKNIHFKIIINKNEHQYKDGECGVYALYFITSRLAGKKCNDINNMIIKDSEMKQKRKNFFRFS